MHHPADAMSGAAGSSMSLLPSLPMVLGHVLAAVARGMAAAARGPGAAAAHGNARVSAHSIAEGALVRSLRGALALVRALRAGLPGAPEAGPRVPRAALLAHARARTAALQHTVIRRGPPAADAFSLAA